MESKKKAVKEVKVGDPATLILWSDLRAMTVTKVYTQNKIEVRENKTNCISFPENRYEIFDEIDENSKAMIFSRRKTGGWVEKGQPNRYGSVRLEVGKRVHSIDPYF